MSRNNDLNLEAFTMFAKGHSRIQIEGELIPKYLGMGLSQAEIRKTISSAERSNPDIKKSSKPILYPNLGIITSLWDSGHRLSEEPVNFHHMTAMSYLLKRNLDIRTLGVDDSARITPTWYHQISWPQWLTWDWCIMVRMWDGELKLRNFQCRSVYNSNPKIRSPQGYSTKGLVLSHDRSIGMLKSCSTTHLYIVEGLPDLLKLIIELYKTLNPSIRWSIVGVTSGSMPWFDSFPTGKIEKALILTHQDDAGRTYANKIYKTLFKRGILTKIGAY